LTKICSKCGEELPATEEFFGKEKHGKYGLKPKCKKCINEYNKEYHKNNKEKISERHKNYNKSDQGHKVREKYLEKTKDKRHEYRINRYINNKEKELKINREWYQNNTEQHRKLSKRWTRENREYLNERERKRRKEDPEFRIKQSLSSSMQQGIKRQINRTGNFCKKFSKSEKLLGTSFKKVVKHLENQFKGNIHPITGDPMSWDNYGIWSDIYEGWEIDHIKPLASFDLLDEDQQKEAFNYKNLQPLWASENRSKQDKILEE